jgi:hypothetical protein
LNRQGIQARCALGVCPLLLPIAVTLLFNSCELLSVVDLEENE